MRKGDNCRDTRGREEDREKIYLSWRDYLDEKAARFFAITTNPRPGIVMALKLKLKPESERRYHHG